MKERPYETRLPQLEMRAEGLLTDRLTKESFLFRLERDGTFFSFLFCPTFSVAPYLQNAPAIPVCSIQPCVFEGKAQI